MRRRPSVPRRYSALLLVLLAGALILLGREPVVVMGGRGLEPRTARQRLSEDYRDVLRRREEPARQLGFDL